MPWMILLLRIIGFLFLAVIGIVFLALFIPLRLRIFWKGPERFAEARFLFFRYRYDLRPEKESVPKEGARAPSEAPLPPRFEPSPPQFSDSGNHENDNLPNSGKKAPKSLKAFHPFRGIRTFKSRFAFKAAPRLRVVKLPDVSRAALGFYKVRVQYYNYLGLFLEAKPVFYRLIKQILLKKLDCNLDFSVDSPAFNAQIIGFLWAMETNLLSFLKRRLKKPVNHRIRIKSDFKGIYMDGDIDCVVSIRPIGLIGVAIRSIPELKSLWSGIRKLKEKTAVPA